MSVACRVPHVRGCSASTPPLYQADIGLSRVSSSGSVSSMAEDTAVGLNMAVMADLVQEKMCDLSEANNGLYHCSLCLPLSV